MIEESTTLFKVFRVLWFPLSVNAMTLGGLAIAAFWGGTWAVVAVAGIDQATTSVLAEEFPRRAYQAILTQSWPTSTKLGWIFAWQFVLFFGLWATLGVAICRIIALRIGRDEYCSLSDAVAFGWKSKFTGWLYPFAVAVPILFLLACNHVAGMITSIPWLGWITGLLILPLVLVSTLLAVIMIVAGVVCVGLVPAAIATERRGTYDSLGKAFNYVFARPLPVILHLLVLSTFLTFISGMLVHGQALERLLGDSMTPLWSDGDFTHMVTGQTEHLEGGRKFFAWGYWGIITAYRLLLWGALVSFTLGAFTALFMILRKDVDGVDYSDVIPDRAPKDPSTASAEPPTGPAASDGKTIASPVPN